MSKILYTLMLSGALAVASPVAFAQGPSPAPTQRTQPHYSLGQSTPAPSVLATLRQISLSSLPMLENTLNLTDAQKTSARELLTKADQDMQPLVAAQKKAAQAFTDGLIAGLTEEKLTALAKTASQTEADILAAKVKTFVAFRALLDEKQASQLSDMLAQASFPWRGSAIPQPK